MDVGHLGSVGARLPRGLRLEEGGVTRERGSWLIAGGGFVLRVAVRGVMVRGRAALRCCACVAGAVLDSFAQLSGRGSVEPADGFDRENLLCEGLSEVR